MLNFNHLRTWSRESSLWQMCSAGKLKSVHVWDQPFRTSTDNAVPVSVVNIHIALCLANKQTPYDTCCAVCWCFVAVARFGSPRSKHIFIDHRVMLLVTCKHRNYVTSQENVHGPRSTNKLRHQHGNSNMLLSTVHEIEIY
jgi:hypothetical protein